ncbi:uncharacterized protein LOC127750755 [Frankliniella occidentalis]|uniref:Uncharacterized protein LOC127750755 n=1 Tax=Frankliniella occidentalis TaxID=133901 RepID=A0A9C6X4V8_FRAOC|nr:uncharacterized protein LOC127750755 [Frankliniella occidentalis]
MSWADHCASRTSLSCPRPAAPPGPGPALHLLPSRTACHVNTSSKPSCLKLLLAGGHIGCNLLLFVTISSELFGVTFKNLTIFRPGKTVLWAHCNTFVHLRLHLLVIQMI